MSPLIEVEEVARMIGMSPDWIYAEVRAGRIPHVKLGRYIHFRRESIEEWICSLERGGTVQGHVKRRGAARTAPGMAQESEAP